MSMTPEQRIERARNAVAARWSKHDFAKMPLDDAIASLAELREEYEKAAKAVQQRMVTPAIIHCHMCPNQIAPGKWTQNIVYRDKSDQLIKTIYFCSARCISKWNKLKQDEKFPDVKPMADASQYLPK